MVVLTPVVAGAVYFKVARAALTWAAVPINEISLAAVVSAA